MSWNDNHRGLPDKAYLVGRLSMNSSRNLSIGLLSIFLLVLVVWVYVGHAKSQLAERFPAPGLLLDVGGYRSHLHCLGEGPPTVIFEAGLNEFSPVWTQVQNQTAKFSRACAYDRAGFGWSERGTLPRTAANMVRELYILLARAGIKGPLVIVGHSFGGLLARQYVQTYPDEVIGLVLVDATHEDYLRRIPAVTQGLDQTVKEFRTLSWVSRLGLMALAPERIPARGLEGEALARYRAVLATSPFFDTAAEETATFEQNLAAARALPLGTLGDMPLVVLSRGQPEPLPFLNVEQNARYEREWAGLQSQLASLSTRGRQIIATRSAHAIPLTEPQLVVDAIRSVAATAP
jgi:pimeloyl-ACP methyl ester carboxylesterase